jgi:tRNA threonylcarbamoyladenosine biosynthesis protein TsaE
MMIGKHLGEILVIEVDSEAETDSVGRAIAAQVEPGTVIGLIGPLGAGKTRFVRAIAESLGVNPRHIASPTFVLIHEYDGRFPVYHFDTYRLRSVTEFDALGPADYFEGEGVCLVEWADKVLDRLPARRWLVQIESKGPTSRRVTVEAPGRMNTLAAAFGLSDFDAGTGGS